MKLTEEGSDGWSIGVGARRACVMCGGSSQREVVEEGNVAAWEMEAQHEQ